MLHQAPIRGAEPGPATVQGELTNNQKVLLTIIVSDFGGPEKSADPVYKLSCVALTVKIGRLCNWARERFAETTF